MDFQVGPWLVRPGLNRVVRGSRSSHITPKAMEVLVCLAKRGGGVVSKNSLFQEAWPGIHVSDDALMKCIGELRRAFHGTKGEPQVIETIAKRGYRVAMPVIWETGETIDGNVSGPAVPAPPAAQHSSEAAPGAAGDEVTAGPPVGTAPRGSSRRSRLMAGAALLLTLGIVSGGIGRLGGFLGKGSSDASIRSIAVLPLTDLTGSPEQDYFAEGMTEELITELAQIEAWKVISRTSVMRYKGSNKSLREIARDLGVAGIVEGTVRRVGDRVRVTAQLIHAGTDTHLWSGSFEGELRDVLELQRNIAHAIARELKVSATSETRAPVSRRRPMVPEAYEDFLKGSYFLDRSQFSKAASHFDRATAIDPRFALAHALFVEAEGMLAFNLDLPRSDKAVRAMETAQALDDTLAEAHMLAGDDKFFGKWDWEQGEAEFRRAVELDRGSVNAAAHYAGCLHAMGRWDAALAAYRRALELDPVSPRLHVQLLGLLVDAHRYEQALEQFRKTIELDPNNRAAHSWAGVLCELQGRGAEATAAYLKADKAAETSAEQIQALESAAGAGGVRGYWRQRLEMLQARAKRERVPPYDFASAYAHLGEDDRAMDMLEAAYQQRAPRLAWIRARAIWQRLRPDPRYQSLLRRMRFPE